jgi:uncharacterized protein (DUF2062 family)
MAAMVSVVWESSLRMPQFQPHTALVRRLRRLLAWLWHQEGSHGQRARGLAAGLFCGCFPFFGLQMLLSVALASAVRGNHLLAAAGTWVSNPFTSLPLYWFNYQLGCWLIGPGVGWPGLDDLQTGRIWNSGGGFINRLLLGSTLVGVACAVLGGWLYWHWLEREHRRGKRQG